MKINAEHIADLSKLDGGQFKVDSLDEAYRFCQRIAKGHYENFPVGSLIVPKSIRKHFYSVYAFSRIADDIGDELQEIVSIEENIIILNEYESLLFSLDVISNKGGNPVFCALRDTMAVKNLPAKPFSELIEAFRRDILFKQADTMEDMLEYCRYSANPVGELILRLFDEYTDEKHELSNYICTALQLVNFWQDISIDKIKKRVYIPLEILSRHGLSTENLYSSENSVKLQNCMNEMFNYTHELFEKGKELIKSVRTYRLKFELALIYCAGNRMLEKTEKYGAVNLVNSRISLNKKDALLVLCKSFAMILK